MGSIVAVLSDLHAGLRLSLLNPHTRLRDANGQFWSPALTVTQHYLWELYLSHRDEVREMARGKRLILFLLGDLTQGLKHWSGVWGTTMYDHITGAKAVLEPYLELGPAVIRLVQGTEAHNDNGTADLLLAEDLARMMPGCDVDIAQHYKTCVDGIPIDYAHHGPGVSTRKWTAGNVASHYLKSVLLEEIVNGDEPPRVVVRAHVHQEVRRTEFLETKRGTITADILVCPGYCGINPYARRATRSPLSQTHGMVAISIGGGQVDIHQLSRMIDVRKEEAL